MQAAERFGAGRRQLVERLFPDGIPALWCPPLTHFDAQGRIDAPRMRAHLASMRPWVGGFLVPGSTGEGWELSADEVREVLAVALEAVAGEGGHLLVGVLKPTAGEAARAVQDAAAWLADRGVARRGAAPARGGAVGFTICPPSGRDLGQDRIRAGLAEVLALGEPTALYQLPQVTGTEMSPGTVAALAAEFPSFYLLKDTSGADRVAASGLRDVFLVRGAEGDYARHLLAAGGRYDGFLLSTANAFGRELAEVVERVGRGDRAGAEALSGRISALAAEVFAAAARVPAGNAFANANKALDHWRAHGAAAARVPPPRLHSGVRLPAALIELAGEALRRHGLMPARGYLEG